jgi:aminoglycoside phosphotransferase (APT) family kinase protein
LTRPNLDPNAILGALGVTEVLSVTPVQGGWDTAIWRVECSNATFALRVFRPDQLATIEREVVAMQAAGAAGIPVPAVHGRALCEDRPALLLSWCPGRRLDQAIGRYPWRIWSLGVEFGRVQAAIHRITAPASLRQPGAGWIEWAGDDQAALIARLRSLSPRTDALLHLDYHPLNVLTTGRRMSAVLDWANALAGDPRADVARTLVILRLAPSQRPSLLETALRRVLAQAWLSGYRQEAGPLRDMPLFYAWAGAATFRDLSAKIGRPGMWLQPHHLEPIRRWTDQQIRASGL